MSSVDNPRPDAEAVEGAWKAIDAEPDKVETQFALDIVRPGDPVFAEAEVTEQHVLFRQFGNTAEEVKEWYDPYREASEFLVVRDQETGQLAGALRIIRDSPAGFKSLIDITGEPWNESVDDVLVRSHIDLDPTKTIDIATIGVEEGYRAKDRDDRNSEVSNALYHACIRYSIEQGITTWVAILDNKVLEVIQLLAEPFQSYDGVASGSYLNSPLSTPVWCDLPTSIERLKAYDKGLYEMFVEGTALEGNTTMPDRIEPTTPESS